MMSSCRRFPLRMLPLLLLGVSCLPLSAGAEVANPDRMLKNIIIDHTISLPGHDFYSVFSDFLASMTADVYFDLVTLKEQRSSRSGNYILIEHNQKVLFRATVYPADRYMEAKAKQAASVVSGKIHREELEALFRPQGGDLGPDEL